VDPSEYPWARADLRLFSLQLRGAASDLSAATFQIADESHTMGNALRWMIMKKYASVSISIVSSFLTRDSPKVEFCGYR
jgi:DNA-directed RNA polymerase I and III subunit RPAC2